MTSHRVQDIIDALVQLSIQRPQVQGSQWEVFRLYEADDQGKDISVDATLRFAWGMNHDSQNDTKRASTVTPFHCPSPSLKYLIREAYINLPDTLSATFSNYSVLSSSSDKMTPFTLLSMKSGQQNIIIAFSILGVKLSPKSDKIMSLHVYGEISNFKFAWILITKMDVRCPRPSAHRSLPKYLLESTCLAPLSPIFHPFLVSFGTLASTRT